jgi:putative FmdB family regulatory protein
MPTYEYGCTRCGQHVEVFQRITEDPLTICGACGGPLRKVFHPAGIVFKGSGFYATDNRSKTKTSTPSSGDSTTSSSSSGSDPSGSPGSDPSSKGSSDAPSSAAPAKPKKEKSA